ncbi:salicylate hydroxylase [Amylostereum chailletii]|nr:salicylate hydroxylase [Amylostereum chailletii]
MSRAPQVKFTVAICGGGIGGLTLANALSKHEDIQVDLYEAASHFGEIGAGLGIWWRGRKILQALGLDNDISAIGGDFDDERVPTFTLRKADQSEGKDFSTIMTNGKMTSLHRAEFHAVLLKHLPPSCGLFNSKRLTSYSQPANNEDPIELIFADGSKASCDVLIGADGLKSAVRVSMMQERAASAEEGGEAEDLDASARAVYSGVQAYRAVVPSETLARAAPNHRVLTSHNIYVGNGGHIVAYPISQGSFVNIVLFRAEYDKTGINFPDPWVSQADPQELLGLFEGWEPEVRTLISCLTEVPTNKWVVNVVKPLPSFSWRRIALLGDAAHAMKPFGAKGVGQAIEDAYILAALLSHRLTSKTTIPHALDIYSQIRRPLALEASEHARKSGMLLSMYGAPNVDEISQGLQDNFDWYAQIDPAEDLKKAVDLLENPGPSDV